MYLLLSWHRHCLKHLSPWCMRPPPQSFPLRGLWKACLGVCGLAEGDSDGWILIGKPRLNRVGWLVQGHSVGVAAPRPVPPLPPHPRLLSLLSNNQPPSPTAPRDCEQVPVGAARPFPLGCLDPTWCFVLPAPRHPQKAAALWSGPPSLGLMGGFCRPVMVPG